MFQGLEGNLREILTVCVGGSGLMPLTCPLNLLAKDNPLNVVPVWSADGMRIDLLSNHTSDSGVCNWASG